MAIDPNTGTRSNPATDAARSGTSEDDPRSAAGRRDYGTAPGTGTAPADRGVAGDRMSPRTGTGAGSASMGAGAGSMGAGSVGNGAGGAAGAGSGN